MLTEPIGFFSHDDRIFLAISDLLLTRAGNWFGGCPSLGRSV